MSTVHNEMMTWNFAQIGKRFLVLAVGAALVLGALNVWLLWPQLSETLALLPQAHGDYLEDAWEMSLAGISGGALSVASLGARTTLLVSGLVGGAFSLGYWLLVAAWLYQQATRAQMNGVLWLVVGLASNLAGVLAFFIARNVLRAQCASCGEWNRKGDAYCSHCGDALEHGCPVCGAAIAKDAHYCSACGKSL